MDNPRITNHTIHARSWNSCIFSGVYYKVIKYAEHTKSRDLTHTQVQLCVCLQWLRCARHKYRLVQCSRTSSILISLYVRVYVWVYVCSCGYACVCEKEIRKTDRDGDKKGICNFTQNAKWSCFVLIIFKIYFPNQDGNNAWHCKRYFALLWGCVGVREIKIAVVQLYTSACKDNFITMTRSFGAHLHKIKNRYSKWQEKWTRIVSWFVS